MDVPNKFLKIGILFTHNGFVAVLKKMSMSFMAEVIAYRIST